MTKFQLLQKYYNHTSFRPGQEKVIDAVTSGRDVLCVMPTGGGKSLCYQIPALLFPGITLVVSPLISLMRDQVSALERAGIPAAYINSSLLPEEFFEVLRSMRAGRYRLIYVAPERLSVPAFVDMCSRSSISFVAVDEAHCISQWGHDFRPDYTRIADFIEQLPQRPVVGAYTATATPRVRDDIRSILKMVSPEELTLSFDRPNLVFSVKYVRGKEIKDMEVRRIIHEHNGKPGIIYCATRKNVEYVCSMLNDYGINAVMYHAGMTQEARSKSQEEFLSGKKDVVVATNAFGMGIDKPDVSFVTHYNLPKTIEAYYQEAGRAGRNGEIADCCLLYSPQDIYTQKWLIEHSEPDESLSKEEQQAVRMRDEQRLNMMISYAESSACLRKYILNYFGERMNKSCGTCSVCIRASKLADDFSLASATLVPPPSVKKEITEDISSFLPGTKILWNGHDAEIISLERKILEIMLNNGTKRRISLETALRAGAIKLI